MFVYELSVCGFETRYCHLNDPCFTDETHASVRSSQRALKIFAKFTGKYLRQKSTFLNEVSGLRAFNFFKKEATTQVFSCKYCKIFKNRFFYRTYVMAASDLGSFSENCSSCLENWDNNKMGHKKAMKDKNIPELAVPRGSIKYTRHLVQLATYYLQEFYVVFDRMCTIFSQNVSRNCFEFSKFCCLSVNRNLTW